MHFLIITYIILSLYAPNLNFAVLNKTEVSGLQSKCRNVDGSDVINEIINGTDAALILSRFGFRDRQNIIHEYHKHFRVNITENMTAEFRQCQTKSLWSGICKYLHGALRADDVKSVTRILALLKPNFWNKLYVAYRQATNGYLQDDLHKYMGTEFAGRLITCLSLKQIGIAFTEDIVDAMEKRDHWKLIRKFLLNYDSNLRHLLNKNNKLYRQLKQYIKNEIPYPENHLMYFLVMRTMHLPDMYAMWISECIRKKRPDQLCMVLTNLKTSFIPRVSKSYLRGYNTTMMQDIRNEFTGTIRDVMLNLVIGNDCLNANITKKYKL